MVIARSIAERTPITMGVNRREEIGDMFVKLRSGAPKSDAVAAAARATR